MAVGLYTRIYIAVPKNELQEAIDLGAVKVAQPKNKEEWLDLGRACAQVLVSKQYVLCYHTDEDGSKFRKWPIVNWKLLEYDTSISDEEIDSVTDAENMIDDVNSRYLDIPGDDEDVLIAAMKPDSDDDVDE